MTTAERVAVVTTVILKVGQEEKTDLVNPADA